MAFVKRNWVSRNVQFPNRRELTDVNTGAVTVVDVARAEGNIINPGDPFAPSTMNDMEERIDAAFNAQPGYTKIINVTASTTLNVEHNISFLYCNASSDITITLPNNTTTPFPVGAEVFIFRASSYDVGITPVSGVQINGASAGVTIANQNYMTTLKKVGTNAWVAIGGI